MRRICANLRGKLKCRAGNEQCSWFGQHVFVFVVLSCFRILNVFVFVFGVFGARCSGIVLLSSVFGVYVLCCSVFGMVVCSVFGHAPPPSLSSGLGGEGVFMNTCSCFVRVRVWTLSACSCFVRARVRVCCVRAHVRVLATFCFVRNPVRAECLFVFGQQCSLPALLQ